MKSGLILALFTAGAGALGCGPSAASNVRSDAPTTGDSIGGACGDEPAPWVIDLPEDKANQLETEMKRGGIVLVRFDCKELKVVRGCDVRLGGDYGYRGLEYEAKHREIENQDTLAMSLSGGPAFAAKVQSEFERGSIFRIDWAAGGRMSTTTEVVTQNMLTGPKCKDATHFVGAMDIGAYVLTSGAAADISAAAEIFGQGAKGGSTSKVKNQSKGGDAEVCRKAGENDASPPPGCRTPLLVQLFPIDPAASESAPPPRPRSRPTGLYMPQCPPGRVPDEFGSCRPKSTATSYICSPGQAGECRAQCDKGNPQSCAILGQMLEKGDGVKEDMAGAEKAYSDACKKRNVDGCTGLGYVYSKSDDPARKEESTRIFQAACRQGNGRACSGLGQQARLRRDMTTAIRYFEDGCRLSYTRACFYAGNLLSRSGRDDAAAYINFKRACSGSDNRGCLAAGSYLMSGNGPVKNPSDGATLQARGLSALTTECSKNRYESCEVLGDFYLGRYGKTTPKGEKAAENYVKACSGGQEDACWEAAVLYDTGVGGARRDPASAKTYYGMACSKGYDDACAKAGQKPPAGPGGPSAKIPKPYCNSKGQPIRPLKPGERCP